MSLCYTQLVPPLGLLSASDWGLKDFFFFNFYNNKYHPRPRYTSVIVLCEPPAICIHSTPPGEPPASYRGRPEDLFL